MFKPVNGLKHSELQQSSNVSVVWQSCRVRYLFSTISSLARSTRASQYHHSRLGVKFYLVCKSPAENSANCFPLITEYGGYMARQVTAGNEGSL